MLAFNDEAMPLTDDELRHNILIKAEKMVKRLRELYEEQVCREECDESIVIVVDLIHPVCVFLEHPYYKPFERLLWDASNYRFVWIHDHGDNNLDTVFRYLNSPEWHRLVSEIDFETCRFDQLWTKAPRETDTTSVSVVSPPKQRHQQPRLN
jgi:hypothetical protein